MDQIENTAAALNRYAALLRDITLYHRYLYSVVSLGAPANTTERNNIANDYEGLKQQLIQLLEATHPEANHFAFRDDYSTPYPVLVVNGSEGWFSLEWPLGFMRWTGLEKMLSKS